MAIEWDITADRTSSTMWILVHDNNGLVTNVLDANLDCAVHFHWEVPAPLLPVLGGTFRLRLFAESIGPGPEVKVLGDLLVPVSPTMAGTYDVHFNIPAGTLPPESGGAIGEPPGLHSGVYRFVGALQHLNGTPAVATKVSGFAEAPLVQFRKP